MDAFIDTEEAAVSVKRILEFAKSIASFVADLKVQVQSVNADFISKNYELALEALSNMREQVDVVSENTEIAEQHLTKLSEIIERYNKFRYGN